MRGKHKDVELKTQRDVGGTGLPMENRRDRSQSIHSCLLSHRTSDTVDLNNL